MENDGQMLFSLSRNAPCKWLVQLGGNDPSQKGNELNSNVRIFGPNWEALPQFLCTVPALDVFNSE